MPDDLFVESLYMFTHVKYSAIVTHIKMIPGGDNGGLCVK